MDEKLIASIAIIASAIPTMGVGLAATTRRWMPKQYANSSNRARLQFILGIGMLAICLSLITFGSMLSLFPDEALAWITIVFVVVVNIEALGMVFLLKRESKKTL